VFELSKCSFEHVRTASWQPAERRRNLAARVADGLAMPLPGKARAASEPQDMDLSPMLRIVGKYPETLQGRAVGILVTDGADGAVVSAVKAAAEAAGASVKLIAPRLAG
jgi:catalase